MIELAAGPLAELYDRLGALSGRDQTLQLQEIVLGAGALDGIAALAARLAPEGRSVLIAQDARDMLRHGVSIKPLVADLFRAAGWAVDTVTLGADGHEVHTDPGEIAQVKAGLGRAGADRAGIDRAGADRAGIDRAGTDRAGIGRAGVGKAGRDSPVDVVVALGSGCVADITKHAVHEVEAETGRTLVLVVAQTANSVCAFTSGVAVVTVDGVKRTLPSRLPDVLLLDTQVLADAPLEYSLGGIGDASVAAVSFADYRLSHLMGLTRWEPLSWELMEFSRTRFLRRDPILAKIDVGSMGAVAVDLAACGLAMTVAGESAPLSGLEHVTSHTLDMAAAAHGRPIGNHGSQCALASVLSLIAWDKVLHEADLGRLDPAAIQDEDWLPQVQGAFGFIDSDGKAWRECWSDFSRKTRAWRDHAGPIRALVADWEAHKEDLARFVVAPEVFVRALAATGHPLRWEDVPTGLTEAQARWAFTNARLMRQRTSVADLLGFAGLWTEDFIDSVFDTYHNLIDNL